MKKCNEADEASQCPMKKKRILEIFYFKDETKQEITKEKNKGKEREINEVKEKGQVILSKRIESMSSTTILFPFSLSLNEKLYK